MYKFVVEGTPLALRKFKPGERRDYDDHMFDRSNFALEIARQYGDKPPMGGPLSFKILYYFSIPRGKRERCMNLLEQHYCARPNISRLNDFIQDALLGVVFQSKYNIVSIYAIKLYDFKPRTELFIGELNAKKN
jgi:Holliday junction resolvase RusA-like endonuclease